MKTVDELMQEAFDRKPWRSPRSDEYKAGVRAVLEYRINGVRVECPYHSLVQSDAFYAGTSEGHRLANDAGVPFRDRDHGVVSTLQPESKRPACVKCGETVLHCDETVDGEGRPMHKWCA